MSMGQAVEASSQLATVSILRQEKTVQQEPTSLIMSEVPIKTEATVQWGKRHAIKYKYVREYIRKVKRSATRECRVGYTTGSGRDAEPQGMRKSGPIESPQPPALSGKRWEPTDPFPRHYEQTQETKNMKSWWKHVDETKQRRRWSPR